MTITKIISISIALVLSTSVNAALIGRLAATPGGTDYQAYYDDVAGLTWLASANYAWRSGYNVDGRMGWAEANNWAAGLSVGGVSGWRLADTIQPDASCTEQGGGIVSYGYNCTGSEMGNLFYNTLGNTAGYLTSTGPFRDLLPSTYFWSATEYVVNPTNAWSFSFSSGEQRPNYNTNIAYAWAVQSGDVSAVPVPAAAWLLGSGLIGLVGFAKRKKT